MPKSKKIRWGIIGAGGIADRRAIPEGILPSKLSTLSMLMDIDKKKISPLAKKYGVPATTKIDELLNSDTVDAVYIATPPYLHAEQIIKAAAAGKHIMCEKPAAKDVAEAKKVAQAVKKNNVKFGMAFMFRYHPVHIKMKQLLQDGVIGQPVAGRAQLTCWFPKTRKTHWAQTQEKGLGGTVIDMASHCMDLLEWFFGQTTQICAFVSTLVHKYKVEDMSTIMQKFANGAHGYVDCLWNVPDRACGNRLEIYGTKGSMVSVDTIGQLPHGEVLVVQSDQSDYDPLQSRALPYKRKVYRPKPRSTFIGELDSFVHAVTEDREPDFPAQQALWNVKLCQTVYQSAKTKKIIKLS